MRPVRGWRDALTVIGFLTPALLLVGAFTLWPTVWAVVQSFTNRALTGIGAQDPSFVGLTNYQRLLSDSDFFGSLGRTAWFTIASAVIGQTLLGLAVAYLMAERPGWKLRMTPLLAAVLILPLAVPETVAALAWASMANGTEAGLLNRMLGLANIGPVNWLQDYAMTTVIVVNVWRGLSFAMVLFLAAFEGLPGSVLEASMVDGATPWQQLRQVMLPMLRRQILMFVLLTVITTVGIFGLVYFLTRGGPGSATELIGIYVYDQAFQFFEIGYGSAAAVILLIILAVGGVYYVRLMREEI